MVDALEVPELLDADTERVQDVFGDRLLNVTGGPDTVVEYRLLELCALAVQVVAYVTVEKERVILLLVTPVAVRPVGALGVGALVDVDTIEAEEDPYVFDAVKYNVYAVLAVKFMTV